MSKETSIDLIEEKLNEIGQSFLQQASRIQFSLHADFKIINEDPPIPQSCYYQAFYLENCIRESLINESLYYLFNTFQYKPQRPPTHPLASFSQSVESYEKAYKYELCFQSPSKSRPIALIYSPPEKQNNRHFSKIYLIDWNEKNHIISNQNNRASYVRISVMDLFDLYFPNYENKLYQLFIDTLQKYIKAANNQLEFDTVPMLTPPYLHHHKKHIQKTLEAWNPIYYEISADKTGRRTSEKKDISQLIPIMNHTLETKMHLSLLGTGDFAKCFITAEYLYDIFKKRQHTFEFTPVICGYLKCIEELLYHCLLLFYDSGKHTTYCKKTNTPGLKHLGIAGNKLTKKEKPQRIPIEKMIYWLTQSEEFWNSPLAKEKVSELLDDYKKTTRNALLHKDNIYDFQDVAIIRQNSITLSLLIIGSLNLPTITDHEAISNVAYNQLIEALIRSGHDSEYDLYYSNTCIKTYLPSTRKILRIDDNGNYPALELFLIQNCIEDTRKDYNDYIQKLLFGNTDYQEPEKITVSPQTMPDKVFYVATDLSEQIWPDEFK